MDLRELQFPICWKTPPTEILRTIDIATRLLESQNAEGAQKRVPLLVNSNYYIAYNALKHVQDIGLDGDLSFCEWGSGLGVVTCIASQIGFHATGIEIEESLCLFARTLASDAGVSADFIQSSYRESPNSIKDDIDKLPFPVGGRKCSVIYAYPWPAEEAFIESLFVRLNAPSALLITYHGGTKLRARMPNV